MDGIARAMMVAKRFESELGYGKATVYPIHSERRRGRVMYHMNTRPIIPRRLR
jgi:hypothetical protein